ncbi:MAG: hypothetical protein AAF518_25465 [Spirochaetota bacterium]
MITIKETHKLIHQDMENWSLHLMNFVDDFRYYKDFSAVAEGFAIQDNKFDPLLASCVEYLCDELNLDWPEWTTDVPVCKKPFFVSGVENLKAMAVLQSPLTFRIRKIFVLENFLARC